MVTQEKAAKTSEFDHLQDLLGWTGCVQIFRSRWPGKASMDEGTDITGLLRRWSAGDEAAGNALVPLVYADLHRRAALSFRHENAGHTLQPTALVNEAFARLVDIEVEWQDRAHFFALSARLMRRLLIDHANAARAKRRGDGAVHVMLDDMGDVAEPADRELLALAEALASLETRNEELCRLIEMQYFGGLTTSEMAEVTGMSVATIGRKLRFARAWLKKELGAEE